MYTQTLLPEKLREFSYYQNKLPLFLQNSYGFMEHFKIWYDVLTGDNHEGLADQADILLYLMNIFDENYLDFINSLPGADEDTSDILDKIAAIFGLTRKFSCTYISEGVETTEQVSLNNEEFLLLIKAQIIKNYCEGTTIQIQEYYDNAGLRIYMKNGEPYAAVNLFLISNQDDDYSDNIKKMFLAGLLHIPSMGIRYTLQILTFGTILKWDAIGVNEVWDAGVWAE